MFEKSKTKKMVCKMISVTLVTALFMMSGCTGNKLDVPELVKPKVMNESFRPVGYSDIGDILLKDAVVVPTDYCHFWKAGTAIAEIHVSIGQYVEKGDLLATADIKQTRENITRIQEEKENYIQNYATDCAIYEQQIQELEYRKQGCDKLNDLPGANQAATELSVMKENHRYDQLLYEYKIKKYDRELSEYYEIIEDGKLYARHSGYVSFCKNLAQTNQVSAVENVVIISDYEDCYINLLYENINSGICDKYELIYTYKNGEKCELQEFPYQTYEVLAAEGRELYPLMRLKFAEESMMPEVGSSVPVYFGKNMLEDVLCVGRDSLYEDSKGYYVYVKTETGKEIRYIEIGKKDDKNVQVVSGLQEGELVFYSSEALVPNDYEVFTVKSEIYKDIQDTDRILKIEEKTTIVFSDYEGELVEVTADDGDEVAEGDTICKIKINEGSAALADMRNTMESMKTTHKTRMEGFDEQIEDLEELQKQPIEQTIEVPDENGNMVKKKQYIARPYFRGEIGCQIAIARLNKEKTEREFQYQMKVLQEQYNKASKNNDGTGIISIIAKEPGVVQGMYNVVGDKIKVGATLCKVETPISPYVGIITDTPLHLNQKVTFIDEGIEETYSGTVIGLGGETLRSRVHITTLEDGIYLNQGGDDGERNGNWAYIQPESEEYFTHYSLDEEKYVDYAARTLTDVFCLPTGILSSEKVLLTGEMLFFVWKIEDGELIKHYVDYLYSAVDEEGYRYDCVVNGIHEGDELALYSGAELDVISLGL